MAVIEEIYTQYEIWCRPLSRTRYSFGEAKKRRPPADGEGTTALLLRMREKERRKIEKSGILSQEKPKAVRDDAHEEYTSSLSVTSESYAAISRQEELKAEDAPVDRPTDTAEQSEYQPRLKRLRAKVQDAIFDYSEIEQEQIEEEIDKIVNQDGYYNEVEPADIDVEYEKERRFSAPKLAIIIGAIIYMYIVIRL